MAQTTTNLGRKIWDAIISSLTTPKNYVVQKRNTDNPVMSQQLIIEGKVELLYQTAKHDTTIFPLIMNYVCTFWFHDKEQPIMN